MYVNIEKIMNEGSEIPLNITEFYPLVGDDITMVPLSRVGEKHSFYAFGDVVADAFSIGPLPEKYVMEYDDYKKAFDKFKKKADDSGENVSSIVDLEELYGRYIIAVKRFAISGVVSVISAENDIYPETTSDIPAFTPGDGLREKLDIESYWKSLMLIIPNIVADASTVIKMYSEYVETNGFKKKNSVNVSSLILTASSFSELVKLIKEALEEADVDEDKVKKILKSDDDIGNSALKEYYAHMLSEYHVDPAQAHGLLFYIFQSHSEKMYEKAGVTSVWNTKNPVVVRFKSKNKDKKEKTSLV